MFINYFINKTLNSVIAKVRLKADFFDIISYKMIIPFPFCNSEFIESILIASPKHSKDSTSLSNFWIFIPLLIWLPNNMNTN
ncbi:unnamed protein product [Blepharisma stoltei]|uniref:Uncharacterized protein n=1 Tax=Blepharisma stoltei TaxID=1481888 RepID=A0AAU9JWR3_9CILI|nr:unnamed protein product [Blepharisma stoltei]